MIRLVNLCKRYQLGEGVVTALDNFNLQVEKGEYLSVMGPSGSGKSTLLNMLGLLDTVDSGEYWLNDLCMSTLSEEGLASERNRQIGFVFQAYHLIERMSARENVELPLILTGIPSAQRQKKVDELLDRLGLLDRADHKPHQLSGGQRQRIAIARAVIRRPSLLLADEPTGNLDSHSGTAVIELLEELNTEGITLLIVTHDPAIGERAKRCLRMCDGRLVSDRGG